MSFTAYRLSSSCHTCSHLRLLQLHASQCLSHVRPAQPTTAGGDSSTNDRAKLVATIQEGEDELAGDEASNIPNEATDNTDSLKDQVSD